jgi:ribosomal subunit interface protein
MQVPLQITSRDFEMTDAIDAQIRKRAAKLERFTSRIISCKVLIEMPHRQKRTGKGYHVRIDITVPKDDLVIKRQEHIDLYAAIADAFDAAERLLEEHHGRQRGAERADRETPAFAKIKTLSPVEGYGFLETAEGDEIYFHRNSVLNDAFDRLEIGTKVRYVEEMGQEGPQASTVELTSTRELQA